MCPEKVLSSVPDCSASSPPMDVLSSETVIGKGRSEKSGNDCNLKSRALEKPCSVKELELRPCLIPVA